jgi:hypothetical protein
MNGITVVCIFLVGSLAALGSDTRNPTLPAAAKPTRSFQYPMPQIQLPLPVAPEATVEALVVWLGADTYQLRRNAFLELLRRGPLVLEAVQNASQSTDVEVSTAAKQLLLLIDKHPIRISLADYAKELKQYAVAELKSKPGFGDFLEAFQASISSNSRPAIDFRESFHALVESQNQLVAVQQAQSRCTRQRDQLETRLRRAQNLVGSLQQREIANVESLIESNKKLAAKISEAVGRYDRQHHNSAARSLSLLKELAPRHTPIDFEIKRHYNGFRIGIRRDENWVVIDLTEGLPEEARRAAGFPLVPVVFDTQTTLETWEHFKIILEPHLEISLEGMRCKPSYSVIVQSPGDRPEPSGDDMMLLLRSLNPPEQR